MYHSAWAVQRYRQCHNLYIALLQTAASALRTGCGFVDHNECIISYNAPTAVQYTDIALAGVLCSIAQVPVAKTTTTPHLIGGKTLHRSLEFFYNLTCKGRLWAITSPIRIMFTSSQWRSTKPTRVATTLVYIYINVLTVDSLKIRQK